MPSPKIDFICVLLRPVLLEMVYPWLCLFFELAMGFVVQGIEGRVVRECGCDSKNERGERLNSIS